MTNVDFTELERLILNQMAMSEGRDMTLEEAKALVLQWRETGDEITTVRPRVGATGRFTSQRPPEWQTLPRPKTNYRKG